ncbi:MAG: LytTR family transcriptional regulator DNA-binding domain-containing protein [Saprospiraceae bacterium]
MSTSKGIRLMRYGDIVHLQGSGSYTTIHLIDGSKTVASHNLAYYDRLLQHRSFFRTHQSHIINTKYLKMFCTEEREALLEGEKQIPVSKLKRGKLIERIEEEFVG